MTWCSESTPDSTLTSLIRVAETPFMWFVDFRCWFTLLESICFLVLPYYVQIQFRAITRLLSLMSQITTTHTSIIFNQFICFLIRHRKNWLKRWFWCRCFIFYSPQICSDALESPFPFYFEWSPNFFLHKRDCIYLANKLHHNIPKWFALYLKFDPDTGTFFSANPR